MKLKIKLKNINEAIATPGQDALSDIEAEKISNEFDADKMDQEIEDREERKNNINLLLEILQQDPRKLDSIAILLAAHRKATDPSKEFDIDGLFEVTKKILIALKPQLKNNLGLNLNMLVNANVRLASNLEDHHENYIANKSIGNMLKIPKGPIKGYEVQDIDEALEGSEKQNLIKLQQYIKNKEKDLGRDLKPSEFNKILDRFGVRKEAEIDTKALSGIEALIKQTSMYERAFIQQLKTAINKMAKGGKDVSSVLITKDGPKDDLLINNLKGVFIITRVLDNIAKEGYKFIPKIAAAHTQIKNHPDLATAINNLNVETDPYIKFYRNIDLNNIIYDASEDFNDLIKERIRLGHDDVTGGRGQKIAQKAQRMAKDTEVRADENLLRTVLNDLILESRFDRLQLDSEKRNKIKSLLKYLVDDRWPEDQEKTERLYQALDNEATKAKLLNSIMKALKPYKDLEASGVTKDIATSVHPLGLANTKIAKKIADQQELSTFEKQYYTNHAEEIEKELRNLANILKENCIVNNESNKDLSQLENIVARFYPYVKEKLKFDKDAKLNLISDPQNAKDPWGKTAYYNPEAMEITIFVDDRHPKDMLRSLSHELVHHAQNCRGEFDKTQALEPGYAQKDPHMRRMEGEAYLLGNGFLVRDFEDYIKSQKNQNLTENKKMKGLTNEQLKTVVENTIKRVMKESKLEEETINEEEVVEETEETINEEEVVEETEEVTEELNETFTSKKDQLLFEKLTKIWTK